MADTDITVTELPDVDENGNIQVNGQGGINILVQFEDEDGVPRDITTTQHQFRVRGKLNIDLLMTADPTTKQLLVSQAQVAIIGTTSPPFTIVELGTPDEVMWEGQVIVRGFTTVPTGS